MAERKFLPETHLAEFIGSLPARSKFVNTSAQQSSVWKAPDKAHPERMSEGLRRARPFNSFKSALLPAREVLARYGARELEDPLDEAAERTVALVGVRGCESRALAYLDKVMLSEPVADPFYAARRRNTIIVCVDCAQAASTCFCNLLGEKAYAEGLFDVNLSPVKEGYLLEAGSDRGREILEASRNLLSEVTGAHLEELEAMRAAAAEQLERQNAEYRFPEDIKDALPKTIEEVFWRSELSECVQCGGCVAVCPTCYCFLLYDRQAGAEGYERVRVWDCCQFTGYTPMAGPPGTRKPDPRRTHMNKFQHRFAHKFWYDPTNWGVLGCVGCGRCGETCPGSIDLRRVLSAVKEKVAGNA